MLETEVGFAPQMQLILVTFLRVLNKGRAITSFPLLFQLPFRPCVVRLSASEMRLKTNLTGPERGERASSS